MLPEAIEVEAGWVAMTGAAVTLTVAALELVELLPLAVTFTQ